MNKALKEWAVVVKALREGRQCLLLRKGGIIERNDIFEVEAPAFLMFPTYEHQDKAILRPEYHAWLDETVANRPGPDKVTIDTYATVEGVVVVQDLESLKTLEEELIWTHRYLKDRISYRPANPLYALILRAYRLLNPKTIPVLKEYGGCLSWIDLAELVSIEGAIPALSDEEFRQRAKRIEERLKAGMAMNGALLEGWEV